jgi:PAS domain S-box-containing protein
MIAMHGYAFLNKEDEHNTIEALKQGSWKGEYIHILNDGSKIVVQSTVNVLPPEAGGGMVAIIRDVTQRKQEEIKAKHQAEQLARANEDLLHFAYAVSHDLHAPLRTITSFSQLLAMKCGQNLGKDGSEFIRWIVEASTRMDTMLRDLLRFATVAGGEAEFSQNVSLLETLSTALAGLRIQIEETQAVITHDDLPEIAGDPGQLVQLFQNLIGNSLKYRRPDTFPQIHVSAERKEDEWVVHVRDNGLGFEDKHSERIFGVFQRLHDKEFAGTGIGLTICKRIAERRGGRIWAEGRPLEGATFSFSIPDSTIAVQSAPAMDWGNVRAALVSRPAQEDGSGAFSHFGELFKLLDLAQAVVRTLDGSILIWTKGAERLFGWTEAEAVGKPLRELIKPDFGVLPVDIEATLLRDGEWIGELKVQRCDGSVIWLASHKILYRDGSGRPQSVIEIHNNITALKEAEAALARSMVQRDLALNAAQMGIWRWDCRSGVVEWSDILESMLGMPPGAFEGTFDAFKARIHPDDWPETEQVINEGLASKGSYFVENRLQRVDGSYCWVRGQGKVVFDDANQPAGLIGVVYDISHRKQREADRQFLLDLSAKTARIASAKEVAEVTVMEVARYLGVLRCVYSESDEDGKRMRVFAEYTTEGDAATDSLRLADYSGIMTDLANNQVVVVNDVATDSRTAEGYEDRFVARNIRSFVLVPLHMEGARLANIGVSFNRARVWQEREIALLHAVAQRLEATLYIARMWQQDKVRQTSV